MSSASLCIASSDPILCFYINKTSQVQVVRLDQTGRQACDRIMRPNEHLLFEAAPDAVLEIHRLIGDQSLQLTRLPCKDLRVSNDLIETMLRWLA
jgi:hypothetical protein